MNLAQLLFDDTPGDRPLVHFGDRTWSRSDLQQRADRLAEVLTALGAVGGGAVGVMLPNGPDPVAALFGTWRAGGVYVPLNPRLTGDEVDHIMGSVDPAAIVTTPELAARFADRFAGRAVVVAEPASWTVTPADPAAAPVGDHRRHDADVALIQFTSGTTGRPKPVLLLHSGVLTLLDGVLAKLRGAKGPTPAATATVAPSATPARAPMPNLIPVSLSLWAGLYNVLFAFRVGSPVVIMDGFDAGQFARLVQAFDIRSTVLPPAAMTMLVDDPDVTDLAPLRFVRSITAPLSPLQARRFDARFGISVLNSYGQTEIGGEIIGWNAADSRAHGTAKLGSVGRPHDGVSVRVVDDAGVDVPAGDPGELWVLTPALSAGYADGGDLSDRLSADGWFRTGDFARVDPDGFVWIEGRVSSMINRGGLKVYPGEVEEVLRLHGDVADVAVVGAPDDRLGEVPWAFIVRREPPDSEPADSEPPEAAADLVAALDRLAREHLAPYKVPARVEFVADLPRNEVGKVLTRDLVGRAGGVGATS